MPPSTLNGDIPTTISYVKTPSAHRSAVKEYDGYFCSISGAKYSAVPVIVRAASFSDKIFDTPKSARQMYPSASSKMFSGFRSR